MGEHEFLEYYGPLDPAGKFNGDLREWEFEDDKFKRKIFDEYFEKQPFELSEWWELSVVKQFDCPNLLLSEIYPYTRYLFRLITISYLYEGMKRLNLRSYQTGAYSESCQLTEKQLKKNCRGTTVDMKNFINRAGNLLQKSTDFSNFKKFKKEQIATWISDLMDSLAPNSSRNIVQERIYHHCSSDKKKCDNITSKKLKHLFSNSCAEDKKLIYKLCSEEDNYFGVSDLTFFKEIIEKSNVIMNINKGGQGVNCLRRFVDEFSLKEVYPDHLRPYFETVLNKLKLKGGRYLEGELFVPGALKEFDDKGLTDFLFASPTPTPAIAKATPKPTPKPVRTADPLPDPIKTPKAIIVTKIKTTPKPTAKPIPKMSVFETAVFMRKKKQVSSISIDMNKFKNEFVFTTKMIKEFAEPLKVYQSRKGLQDMKKLDGLGQKSEPMTLFFLKYLLDQQAHQSLWNIVSIIGSKFYVVNDIERKKQAVFVEIKNDKTTKGKWQLSILRNP